MELGGPFGRPRYLDGSKRRPRGAPGIGEMMAAQDYSALHLDVGLDDRTRIGPDGIGRPVSAF